MAYDYDNIDFDGEEGGGRGGRGGRGERGEGGGKRSFSRRKVCKFCADRAIAIDY